MSRAELIEAIRLEAGRSGAVEVLKLLRKFSVWECEEDLPYPIPSAGPEMWEEVLDVLIADANK